VHCGIIPLSLSGRGEERVGPRFTLTLPSPLKGEGSLPLGLGKLRPFRVCQAAGLSGLRAKPALGLSA